MSKLQTVSYLGHSAIFIKTQDGLTIGIDPWLMGNPSCPEPLQNPERLDLIVLTHGHSDHAGDCLRLQKLTNAKVAATFELAMILKQEGLPESALIPMNKGGTIEFNQISVSLSHAFHSSSFDLNSGVSRYAGEACSAIIRDCAGTSIFHAGDTALFSDLALIKHLYQPQLAFLPIGDRFTMNPQEAALAAQYLGVKVACPIHYKTFALLTGTAPEFIEHCSKAKINARELEVGLSYEISKLIS